jgi:hypothetical protein
VDIKPGRMRKNGHQKGKFLLGTFLSERKVPPRGGGREVRLFSEKHFEFRIADCELM